MNGIDLNQALIFLLVVVISISVHEFAHALSADRLGDDLPRRQGRLTLLPTEHFDPIGFLMLVFMAFGGMGLGWGKPVQVNLSAFRHPRRDLSIVAAAGPFSNLLIAIAVGIAIRIAGDSLYLADGHQTLTGRILYAFVFTNLNLLFFNLIPIPPLDGSKILSNFLPFDLSVRYDVVMGQYGFIILIGLLFLGRPLLSIILGEPVRAAASLILGPMG